jgi:DNA-binding PadR family transcriptional regulator
MVHVKRDPSDYLPLTAAMYHVLVALAEDEQHGYAIIKAVSRLTDGEVTLSTGTLYGIIKRLLAEGMIVESARRPAAARDDERRRYYRLTEFGRRVVVAEAERLQKMIAAARATRLLADPGKA